ncbi:site-specific integrase [Enterococcus sp. 669A]|uniref:Site-specific integrase n=1 Tax=Candidatus Enterococcus moelleringii TaxID=2815325 RepID=A0ABS3L9Z7_9ENTE|nr:site-specific integrase [Enterococcus sp. 669A]MBO1306449.1 site-specific integrase [Enterococcus sp. 669A]
MSKRGENIYKRRDKRWEGRYHKGRTLEGKIRYGSIYGDTYNEVKQKLYPYKIKYQTIMETQGSCSVPLAEWVGVWLAEFQSEWKPATYANYHHKLKKYILPAIGDQALNKLTKAGLEELAAQLLGDPLSPSTIEVVFRILSNCLSQAVRKELLKSNPCEQLKLPRKPQTKIRALTKKEQKNLEDKAKEVPLNKGLPILLALQTGMRIGEIAALQWKDIDFDSNLIHVSHTYQRVTAPVSMEEKTLLIYGEVKTRSSNRVIPITNELKKVLLKKQKQSNQPFVFSVNGHPCEPRLLTSYFHKLRKAANIEDVHFHQLRHTFATRCIETRADIASVSALLGHASAKMTLDIYTDATIDQRIQVIKLLNAA